MNYKIVREFPNDILFERDDVCISIYQPTHRDKSGNQQDKILFKNQIQKAERSLKQKYSGKEIEELLEPLYKLEEDFNFWRKVKDGIAVLLNRRHCIIYNIDRDVQELTVVSDSFHIKPLIRVYQSADEYYVLGINRKNFKVYHGDRYGLNEVASLEDLEDESGEKIIFSEPEVSRDGMTAYSTGSNRDEWKKHTEKNFRFVDKFVWDNYSNPSKAPLVLVALDQYLGEFRKVTKNAYLIEKGIVKDFESMGVDEINQEAWKIVEKLYLERTAELVGKFNQGKNNNLSSDSLKDVAEKAVENRIEILLLESDKLIPGKVDMKTGELEVRELSDVDADDILDDIAELVLQAKGEVVVLPKERMPTETGVAAIYRY